MTSFQGKTNAVDELVCFQEAQILPLFVVILKSTPSFTQLNVKPPFNEATQIQSPLSPLPMSGADFEKLTVDQVIQYLNLDDRKQLIFYEQEIDGEALMNMSLETLERYGIPGGPATKILTKIPKKKK